MKCLYNAHDQYMIRVPIIPNSTDKVLSENELRDMCKDKVFREQILVASKNLYEQMNIYLDNPEKMSSKKKRNFIQAISKYILRRKTRTTPFGLFSAVGIGHFNKSNEDNLTFKEQNFRKTARVDIEWLLKIIKEVEQKEYRNLTLKLNNAVYLKGDRARILYNTGGNIDVESIRITPAFKVIYDSAVNNITFHNIIAELREHYSTVPIDKLEKYVLQLIEKEFLISTLRPPLTVIDQFQYFIENYFQVCENNTLYKKLINIKKLITNYNQLQIGEGEDAYLVLYNVMNELSKSTSPVQVDTFLDDQSIGLDNNLKNNINEAISMLTILANGKNNQFPHLQGYMDKFIDKYGVDREVSLVEMLDTNNGLGAPATYKNPENQFYEPYISKIQPNNSLKAYLLSKYFMAIQNNSYIELTDEEIASLVDKNIDAQEIPVSLDIYFIMKKIDNKIKLYLGPTGGSQGAGKTFGRFSYLSDEVVDLLETLNKKEKEKINSNFQTCELNYIPDNLRSGNVTRNIHFKDNELSLFTTNSRNQKREMSISDILIGVHNNKFYARDKKTNNLLLFQTTNMLNIQINNNAIRFLLEIALSGKRNWCEFPWNQYYTDFMYKPEIRYKDIILSLEQWSISKYDLNYEKDMSFEAFHNNFKEFHNNFNLPDEFYLVDYDNRILISIHDEDSLKILYMESKKLEKDDTRIILQAVEKGDDVIINNQNENHCSEIVVSYFNKEKENDEMIPEKLLIQEEIDERLKFPFDNWLYFKLYTNKDREDELISFDILEFCEQLKANTGIEYFFMRYLDPKPHIRLRFKADNKKLLFHYPAILKWIKELKEKDIISDAVIGTYEREIERYGGFELIGAAEDIFIEDSKGVQQFLRLTRTKEVDIPIKHIGIISVIKLMEQFGLSLEQQLEFLNSYKRSTKYNDYFRKNKETLIALYQECSSMASFSEDDNVKKIMRIIESRSTPVKKYLEQYSIMQSNVKVTYFNILSSFIHLHCNRIFGVDKDAEDMTMALATNLVNSLKYYNKKGEEDYARRKIAI